MKKRLLYFVPDNPFGGKSGNRTRYLQLLDYLSSLSPQYEVEFLSLGDHSGPWEEVHKRQFAARYPNMKLHIYYRRVSRTNKVKKFFAYRIPTAIPRLFSGTTVDLTHFILRNNVRKLVRQGNFDTVIASYASWGRIFDGIDPNIEKIIDTHDFLTAQRHHEKNKIGKLFQSEMNILRKFDYIWTYSSEEAYLFEQFTDAKVIHLPTSVGAPAAHQRPVVDPADIIYVASANRHNVSSAQWLCKEVLPYLGDLKIQVVGKICEYIDDHPNIVKQGMVENIALLYQRCKIAICPMLSGTGVKIKVIEALSYDLPVVTTRRGMDGLLNKVNNGCIVAENGQEFAEGILRLMHDESYYEKHRHDARSYFQLCHAPSLEKKMLDGIFLGA